MDSPWLTIIGIGEDGLSGLSEASRKALAGAETVFGSGVASNATVYAGGNLNVSSGGETFAASLTGSASATSAGAHETVFNGGIASGTTLSSSGALFVSSGGLAVGTTVDSRTGSMNGGLQVSSGGTASSPCRIPAPAGISISDC